MNSSGTAASFSCDQVQPPAPVDEATMSFVHPAELPTMRIGERFDSALVTGGAGFIGGHLTDALVPRFHSVTVYDDLSVGTPGTVPDGAELVEADVRDERTLREAVEQADIVFHVAAEVNVERSVANPADSSAVNVDPMLTVLDAARETDTRVVFSSSAAIYGQPEYTPIDEAHPKTPTSPYGLEKLTADHYCRLYHDLYGVETVVLRYFNVYGSRQQDCDYSDVITTFQEQARADEPITVEGDGTQTRDFVHVDDIVQATLLAATTHATGEAFNIGTGTTITVRELAETIRDISDSRSDIVHVDPRNGDVEHSQADITKAQAVLGYEFDYTIHEGLESYIG